MNYFYHPVLKQVCTEAQIKSMHPRTMFQNPFVPPSGWHWLNPPAEMPTFDPSSQRLDHLEPILDGGNYFAQYAVVDLPESVKEARSSALAAKLVKDIDADVDRFYTSLSGARTIEYEPVLRAAKAWLADQDGIPVPDGVFCYADSKGISAQEAAEQIVLASEKAEQIVMEVRRLRMHAKSLVRLGQIQEALAFWETVRQQLKGTQWSS